MVTVFNLCCAIRSGGLVIDQGYLMSSIEFDFELFRHELLLEAEAAEVLQATAFFDLYADAAIDNGDVEHIEHCPAIFEGTPRYRIDGYSLNIEQGELCLAVCDFRSGNELAPLNAAEAESSFKLADRFYANSCNEKFINNLEDSSPTFQAAYLIFTNRAVIKRVRIVLLTNARMAIRKKLNTMREENGVRFSYSILDFERYASIQNSRNGSEPIELDFEEHGLQPLPCLKASSETDDYASYLVVMPGTVLAEIYGLFGARLLEANVRTFLQAKTKVNSGIINTLKDEPANFFAFNNGLTATASDIELGKLNGDNVIRKIRNLQIVNGGQTTASILYARDKGKADLARAYVQMKLSVVSPDAIEELVPLISRFANTQNKISEADFFSSHPFHVHLEKISRRVSAPPREGSLAASKWFYERARGQYKDEQAYMTPAARTKFQIEYPRDQLVVKTDLAKSEMSFLQKPHLVSRAAQKCFLDFAGYIDGLWDKDATNFGDGYFRDAMMRLMIFRWTDKMIASSEWYKNNRAHKSQTVTYTLAVLASLLKKAELNLDYKAFWPRQSLPEPLSEFLTELAPLVAGILNDAPSTTRNIAEYCKTQACWSRVEGSFTYDIGSVLGSCAVSGNEAKDQKRDDRKVRKIDTGIDAQMRVMELASRWPAIREFGIAKRLLTGTEAGVLQKAQGGLLSDKQSKVALGALDKLIDNGFKL